MKHLLTKLKLGAASGILLVAGSAGSASAAGWHPVKVLGSPPIGKCKSSMVQVALAANQPADQEVGITFCQPHHWAEGEHQVDALTSGATYTRTYWDWQQDPALYSYVDKTLQSGRATLTYDRMGSGVSSRPVSGSINTTSDAYVLHQLVDMLHSQGYDQITSVGHSYGSGIALREASTYHDVSRVVLTGYLHAPANSVVVNGSYPANLDPMFAGQGLDNGYLTTKPNTRGIQFYSSSADPTVIAYDEAHKDLVTGAGLGSLVADRSVPAGSNLSNAINVPLLIVNGQQDTLFCYDYTNVLDCGNHAAVVANEAPYYTGAPNLTVSMVANTGHDLPLHPSANTSFATIDNWIRTH
jgi:pimeloyl-ACP methyl ester carboxylesterase